MVKTRAWKLGSQADADASDCEDLLLGLVADGSP